MLRWESLECVFHCESSHAHSIETTWDGLSVAMEQARACRTVIVIPLVRIRKPSDTSQFIGSCKHRFEQRMRQLLVI